METRNEDEQSNCRAGARMDQTIGIGPEILGATRFDKNYQTCGETCEGKYCNNNERKAYVSKGNGRSSSEQNLS